jgi:hypothetical protein
MTDAPHFVSPPPKNRTPRKRMDGARSIMTEVDGRSAYARRWRDLCALLISDAGGADRLSELKLGLIRRAATLMLSCERLEADLAEGRPADLDLLGRLVGHTCRIAEVLGLNRVSRDVTPSLDAIVRDISAKNDKSSKPPKTPIVIEDSEDVS